MRPLFRLKKAIRDYFDYKQSQRIKIGDYVWVCNTALRKLANAVVTDVKGRKVKVSYANFNSVWMNREDVYRSISTCMKETGCTEQMQ